VIAQTDWKPAKPDPSFPMVAPIDIQLYITNLSDSDILLPTYKAFGIKIVDADGKEVMAREIGKAATSTGPILLAGGSSFSIRRRVDLRWDEKTKASELVYHDGTGLQTLFGPLAIGRYKVMYWYAARPDEPEKRKLGMTSAWVGEAVTNSVLVDVLDGTTRGLVRSKDEIRNFTEPLRVRESKPVIVNNAKFEAVAQAEWRTGVDDKSVPIEVQLRITNQGTSDQIFPTFDTFGVRIVDADGRKVARRGGRDLTAFTRPILIPPGVTYALAADSGPPTSNIDRGGVLHWDSSPARLAFSFFDGTGSAHKFSPLAAGQNKISFWYRVRAGARTDSRTWLGDLTTDEVSIEVFPRK